MEGSSAVGPSSFGPDKEALPPGDATDLAWSGFNPFYWIARWLNPSWVTPDGGVRWGAIGRGMATWWGAVFSRERIRLSASGLTGWQQRVHLRALEDQRFLQALRTYGGKW